MHLTSVYEYLELRYNSRLVRWMASFTFVVTISLYLGVALYAPCVRLEQIITFLLSFELAYIKNLHYITYNFIKYITIHLS